jgi:hypothetical protein
VTEEIYVAAKVVFKGTKTRPDIMGGVKGQAIRDSDVFEMKNSETSKVPCPRKQSQIVTNSFQFPVL